MREMSRKRASRNAKSKVFWPLFQDKMAVRLSFNACVSTYDQPPTRPKTSGYDLYL